MVARENKGRAAWRGRELEAGWFPVGSACG